MKTFTVALFLAASITVSAQTTVASLEQLLEQVRANNPGLKAEQFAEQISETRLKSAWSVLLPQVKAFGSFDNNISLPVQLVPAQILGGPEGEFAEVQFGTRYNASFGAEASLSLINVANWKNIASATLAEKAAGSQYAARHLSLVERASTAYYFALLSREAVRISTDLVNAADSLLTAAEARLENGLIEPMEYNRVKAIYLESVTQRTSQEGTFQKNVQVLKALAGMSMADSLALSEIIPVSANADVKPAELIIGVKALPEFQVRSYHHLQTLEDLKRQRARILPEVSLFARYSRQSFGDDYNFVSGNQPWYEIGVVGLRAEWNLFSGFNRQSGIRQASLQSQIASEELKDFTLQAESELGELRLNHQVATRAAQYYQEHYALNAENYRIAGVKYNEGVYSIDQYVNIYREFVTSQNQYLNHLANYLVYESIIRSRNTLK